MPVSKGEKPKGKPENLIPLNKRTKEAQREIQSMGGKTCAETKRKRRLMSQIYGEYIEKKYGENGKELFDAMDAILKRKDSSTVSLLKEIRDGTEGSKLTLDGDITVSNMTDDQLEKAINAILTGKA